MLCGAAAATSAPLVGIKLLQRLELAALLAETAVHPVDWSHHGRQVQRAHLVALVVGFGGSQVHATPVHLQHWPEESRTA